MALRAIFHRPMVAQSYILSYREAGEATYSLKFDGEEIVPLSRLGITTTDADFSEGLELVGIENSSFDETWEPVWGQFAKIETTITRLRQR